ncbi:MAG: 30S ribosomal protein S4 [Candidatus Helarchaeota archaeon]
MGDIKKNRKKYSSPLKPWEKERINEELKLIGKYGLRNKKEIWRLNYKLSNYRRRARRMLTLSKEQRRLALKDLNTKLYNLGITSLDSTIDHILGLTIEDLLERRLQTIVYNKGLAVTQYQARQLIVHGHIAINNKRVSSPGRLVLRREEDKISYFQNSPIKNPDHPSNPKSLQ